MSSGRRAVALRPGQLLAVGGMLFSMFFGAGNLIFPPFVGAQAGAATVPAIIGFIVSAVGLPILGVLAVTVAGGFDELEPEWREEGALFTRRGLQVVTQPIDRACLYLLLISASSPRVDQCVAAVAEAYPRSKVPELLRQCVAAGALIIE